MKNPPLAQANAGSSVTIATARDMTFVRDLQKRFSNQLGFLPNEALAQYVTANRVLLIRDNGEPAGYLLGASHLACMPTVRPLTQTAICYDAQRQSLGLALVAAAARSATANGQRCLQAWCRADIPANQFWAAAGFLPIAQRQTSNARRHPLILWRLPLTANLDVHLIRMPARAGHHGKHLANARFLHPLEQRQLLASLLDGEQSPAGQSRQTAA